MDTASGIGAVSPVVHIALPEYTRRHQGARCSALYVWDIIWGPRDSTGGVNHSANMHTSRPTVHGTPSGMWLPCCALNV